MTLKKSGRKDRARLHIREVEKKLFSYLYINKVATSKQIARDVFDPMSHQALYKRLNLLIAHGFLSAIHHRELRGRLVYSLDEKAFREFIAEGSVGLRRQLQSDSPLHDLDLVDIRRRMRKLSMVEQYYSENVLRSGAESADEDELGTFKSFHFDGVLKVRHQDRTYFLPLEYERSRKFSARYVTYFRKLYANSEVESVLFICADDKLRQYIQQIERTVITQELPKTFYALISDVLENNESLAFQNLNEDKIILR